MNKRKQTITAIAAAFGMAIMILDSKTVMQYAYEGIDLCIRTVIPSLFPFLAISNVITANISANRKKEANLLERYLGLPTGTQYLVTLGLLGGYPSGAQNIYQAYKRGYLGKQEAERLLPVCNNAGPAFALGFVGLGLLGSLRAGVWLYLLHALSALLIALLFRPRQPFSAPAQSRTLSPSFSQELVEAITSAGSAMVQVCAFITFFYTALHLLTQRTGIAHPLALGFVELTCGLTRLTPTRAGFVMAAGLLGWGGLSVHAQTAAALSGTGVSLRNHLRGKFLQGIFSAILAIFAWFLL